VTLPLYLKHHGVLFMCYGCGQAACELTDRVDLCATCYSRAMGMLLSPDYDPYDPNFGAT
jgi:hypothetical protein